MKDINIQHLVDEDNPLQTDYILVTASMYKLVGAGLPKSKIYIGPLSSHLEVIPLTTSSSQVPVDLTRIMHGI